MSQLVRFSAAGACLLAALLSGCAGAKGHRTAANGTAPGLREDDAPHGRGGTNPNAPFTLIDRTQRGAAQPVSASSQDLSPCTGHELAMTEVAADVNGGVHHVQFAFVNQAQLACRIGGYPSIQLLGEQGEPVAAVAVGQASSQALKGQTTAGETTAVDTQAESGAAPEIVLNPHGEAYFGVRWTTGDDCPMVNKIEMTAPGTSQSFTVTRPLRVCAGQVRVTALEPTQGAS